MIRLATHPQPFHSTLRAICARKENRNDRDADELDEQTTPHAEHGGTG
jgi:hypothetical protein